MKIILFLRNSNITKSFSMKLIKFIAYLWFYRNILMGKSVFLNNGKQYFA